MQIYYCIPATTIFQDEAAYCLQDTFKLTKAIMKCQLDIFEQIGLILAELQEQARLEAEEGGGSVQNFSHILQQPVGNAWFRIELQ